MSADTNGKKPFHEVITRLLAVTTVGITGRLSESRISEMSILLTILEESKMPAAAAHRIAQDNATLPELLRYCGQSAAYLAEFSASVLEDLRGREDEKKSEPSATPRLDQISVENDPPAHPGN